MRVNGRVVFALGLVAVGALFFYGMRPLKKNDPPAVIAEPALPHYLRKEPVLPPTDSKPSVIAQPVLPPQETKPSKPVLPPKSDGPKPFLPLRNPDERKKVASLEAEMDYVRLNGKPGGNIPEEAELKTLPDKAVQTMYHSFLDNFGIICHRTIRPGSIFNGGYRICDDAEYRPQNACIIYSFGTGQDFSFEDEAIKLYGCHVYYFNPSLKGTPKERTASMTVYSDVCLGGKGGELNDKAKSRLASGVTPKSFSDIKAMLGHSDRTVDVVKMDLETMEYLALSDMMATGETDRIRQLIVEFHNYGGAKTDVVRPRLSVLRDLDKTGFKIFSTNMEETNGEKISNAYPVLRAAAYEISMLNTKHPNSQPIVDVKPALGSGKPGVVDMAYLRSHGKERGGLLDSAEIKAMEANAVYTAYHSFLDNGQFHCKLSIKLGNLGDGGYKICDDEKYRPRKNCLAYSFGIRNDFSFDDGVARVYGCEVFSFDPSMAAGSHRHNELVTYHKVGLGGANGKLEDAGEKLKAKEKWRVESLADIKQILGHSGRTLDILKIDIEGSEWPALEEIAASGEFKHVRQLIMEFHTFGSENPEVMRSRLQVIALLERAGFSLFYTWQFAGWHGIIRFTNQYPVTRTVCYEASFINTKFVAPVA